jgi:hypothetical protein
VNTPERSGLLRSPAEPANAPDGQNAEQSGGQNDELSSQADPIVDNFPVSQKTGGLGFMIVPMCSPQLVPGNSSAMAAPFGASGTGFNLNCNPSDLSGPSQQAGQMQTQADRDTSQPPPNSSAYFFGGSSLSSPERPNGAPIFPVLYPPNTSQGTLIHPSGTGSLSGAGAQSGIAGINGPPVGIGGINITQTSENGAMNGVTPSEQPGQKGQPGQEPGSIGSAGAWGGAPPVAPGTVVNRDAGPHASPVPGKR